MQPFARMRSELMMLDALAIRYHSDPWTVAQWSPERIAWAMAAKAATASLAQQAPDPITHLVVKTFGV